MSTFGQTRCKHLVLDAGPLLSLSPLRGMAETYYTVPQVLSELKDQRAREHFERLALNAGVLIEVRSPDSAALAHVIQHAKTTGDYAVLSYTDLCVVALTYALHVKAKKEEDNTLDVEESTPSDLTRSENSVEDIIHALDKATVRDRSEVPDVADDDAIEEAQTPEVGDDAAGTDIGHEGTETPGENEDHPIQTIGDTSPEFSAALYDDPSDDDDGEGEWITPSNVALHKSRALHLLPHANGKSTRKPEVASVGCMTADFAMQNLLLHMGLNLIGVEGERIEKVKTWVLRCHACFKICKDVSRKFCPSCGNATLLRASVTTSSTSGASSTSTMQVHLKKNFQYRSRGTIYSIPAPKPGTSKTGTGEGLILREDQTAYLRAKKQSDRKREREMGKMMKGVFANGGENKAGFGTWTDPDWLPGMMSANVGQREKRTGSFMDGDMPVIGYGRRNPNERRRRK